MFGVRGSRFANTFGVPAFFKTGFLVLDMLFLPQLGFELRVSGFRV